MSDLIDKKIYAYRKSDGSRNASEDFDTLRAAQNESPTGIWSDGATMWVADNADKKLYAYRLSEKTRDASKEFNTLEAARNEHPVGLWSDSATMWVSDYDDDKLYAYRMSDKARDAGKDFDTLSAAANGSPRGIWLDGTTMWVADPEDDKLYAYQMSDKARDTSKDFDTLSAAGNTFASGIWSDGATMWVTDLTDDKVHSYNMPLSTDATLSALTVSPKDIIGFASDRTSYEVGVASTVTQATVAATANDSGATVAITPGQPVDLSAGKNTVTVTVTAQDSTTTKTYTVNVNQGVTAPFGWKAGDDLDGMIAAGNETPYAISSDGTTVWLSDIDDDKLYAYRLSDGERDTGADFDTLHAAGNRLSEGIWTDGTTMWAADPDDDKLYAYRVSDKERDTTQDFDTLKAANNDTPTGIWSDGATMWVADPGNDKIYAYRMSDKTRDASKDFDTLIAAGNEAPLGIWSDGATMWVSDFLDLTIYAYKMSDKTRDSTKDFDTLDAAGNTSPRDIWSDGATMWVTDFTDDKAYAYNMAGSTDAALSALTVSPRDIIGFAPDRTSYEVGMASTVTQATVSATTNHAFATVGYSGAGADTAEGRQVDLSHGKNTVTVTVTAQDGTTTKTYTVNVNRGVSGAFGWKASDDLDGLIAAGNYSPRDIWSNGQTMWVVDSGADKLYAYRMSDKARDAGKDFNTLSAAGNNGPTGIWSDGTTMWVADFTDDKIYAYRMSDKMRDASKDFDTLDLAGNKNPRDVWSDGDTMWVTDYSDAKIYAYRMSDKARDDSQDFDTLAGAANNVPVGLWSDGTTMWVTDSTDDKIYAYRMSDKTRDASKDFDTLGAAGNNDPNGIWSDGTTMWVADNNKDKVYSYNMPTSTDATLRALTVSPKGAIELEAFRFSPPYEVGLASTVTQTTVTATATNSNATISYGTTGRQVDLSAGQNTVTVTVTAQDGTTTRDYTVNINRGVSDAYGWKAADDLDGLIAAENTSPRGIWSDETTIWVSDASDDKIYAYHKSDKTRDSSRDFDTLEAANNGLPYGMWSNGNTMWVADPGDDKIYAYRMADKQRDASKDFDTLIAAGNNDPTGIWSDGATMWVTDPGDDKIYAYRMSDKTRDTSKDFDTLNTAGNESPTGIWSDSATMWVADRNDAKLYAYRMSDKTRDASRDFNTLSAAGNDETRSITSDGVTMWTVDSNDDKAYSYNMDSPPPGNLQATTGNTRVTLRWSNPDDSDITGYQYRVSDDDGNTWNPDWTDVPGSNANTTSHTVRDLTNNVPYTFQLRVLRGAKISLPSQIDATPLGPPTAPGAPTDLGLAHRDGALSASWTRPREDSRAPVTSYPVRYRRAGSSASWTNVSRSGPDDGTSQLITGLTNRRHYEVQAAAANRIGTSAWTDSVIGTPQAEEEPPTNTGSAQLSVGQTGSHWTPRFGSNELHEDTLDLNNNAIVGDCIGTEAFRVHWAGPGEHREADRWEAHFITRQHAGIVTSQFRRESNSNRTSLHGTLTTHGDASMTVRVRGNFGSDGWGHWSPPVILVCIDEANLVEEEQASNAGQQAPPENSPATGQPIIAGTPDPGSILAASTSGISDSNGLEDVEYTYQWTRYDGASNVSITDAASSTYTVAQDDVGYDLKVTVSFTDDDGFAESLTSPGVHIQSPQPLYGSFREVPETHDGSATFTVELHFSEDPDLGFQAVRDHVLNLTNGSVTRARRTNPSGDEPNRTWTITVRPGGSGDVAIELPATTDCSAQGAVCTTGGKMLSNQHTITVPGPGSAGEPTEEPQDPPPVNSPATGKPAISGAPAAGQTLTASTSSIGDANGLTGVSYSYQWLRTSGAATASISGAATNTYAVTSDDQGKSLSVRVAFTDDDGFDESLTSDAVSVPAPLTGEIPAAHLPASHDGSSTFTLRIAFSESPALGYVNVRDHVLEVTNGGVTRVRRVTQGSDQRWSITIEPGGNADVTIVLPATTDCTAASAVCTAGGRKLSNRSTATVAGPGG